MRITYSRGIATVTFDSQRLLNIFPIDDLPDIVLVDILCRLPWKFVLQCKCVCRSWLALISHPYFNSRRALYLRNHCDDDEKTLMFVKISRPEHHARELFTISKQTPPVLTTLNFLPRSLIHSLDIELVVVATYNDLILLCETWGFQRKYKYYICNIYTKQWVAIPPTIQFPRPDVVRVGVGFICDSDYRCLIVRLIQFEAEPDFRLKVEMFSSETGKWIESVVLCPQRFRPADLKPITPALAYDGTLYWLGHGGFLIGLEPFKLNHNHHCRFISRLPVYFRELPTECLGVCWGCVRLCRLYVNHSTLDVWELKEDDDREVDEVGGKMMKWCLKERVIVDQTFLRSPELLALDPNDEDILYLRCSNYREAKIVTYDIRTMKVIDISRKFPCPDFHMDAFPFVLPWWQWPTPVPRLDCHTN
ncbi:putative F-box domain-containing protein [Rosa chinensis]|uniref:Putative F-box domain-containing protein n=1 Tax=Rosa chinensis TaxID=74649 RepID=A0A2P6PW90_ROSCH|nr:putative F-box/kelch-repeat protein At4g22430 [Rosa chinensis]PRQ26195.1 putative F-box domain-containing protein [Rosa chinensis]